jgi:hypothetical protein
MLTTFLIGLGVGALLMAWVFSDGAYEAEQQIEFYKREYGYSYADLTAAWRNGRDGGPPVPPRPL